MTLFCDLLIHSCSNRIWRISWICQYRKNKARMLEFSLYKSSRVVPRVTLAPFIESQVQNLWIFFFASLACGRVWYGLMRKLVGLKKFFQKCSQSPILTPGVSTESSFKSRWRIPNLNHLSDHLRSENAEKLLKIQISCLDFPYFSNIS